MAHQGSGVSMPARKHVGRGYGRTGLTAGAAYTLPVAGATAWWDAAQISGVADGTALSSWPDVSGGGHTIVQATGANQPVYYSSTAGQLINNLPAVRFTVPQFMATSAALAVASPFTWTFVGKASVANQTMYMLSSNAANLYLNGNVSAWKINSNGAWQFGTPDTNLHLFIGVFNNGNLTLTIDASVNGPNAASNIPMSGNLALGSSSPSTATLTWPGAICEATVYPFAFTAGNMTSWRTYTHTKWGTP